MIDFTITENDSNSFEKAMSDAMGSPLDHFDRELIKIRTGRANVNMIEDLPVACYGQAPMPLKTIAVLGAPDAKLLTIQPWDVSIIGDVEKSIVESDLGLSPDNDGKIIRLRLPDMSTTRREELVKILHKKLEECKIGIRNVRKEFHNLMKVAKKDKAISEDFYNRLDDSLQKVTNKYIKLAEEMSGKKEKDLRAV